MDMESNRKWKPAKEKNNGTSALLLRKCVNLMIELWPWRSIAYVLLPQGGGPRDGITAATEKVKETNTQPKVENGSQFRQVIAPSINYNSLRYTVLCYLPSTIK